MKLIAGMTKLAATWKEWLWHGTQDTGTSTLASLVDRTAGASSSMPVNPTNLMPGSSMNSTNKSGIPLPANNSPLRSISLVSGLKPRIRPDFHGWKITYYDKSIAFFYDKPLREVILWAHSRTLLKLEGRAYETPH